MTDTGERPLLLHEYIDIVGQHQWSYMEHTKAQAGHEKVDFELFGTWYTMGITGQWPQVVNVWDIPGGWDGWAAKVDRLGLKRKTNRHLEGWWETAYTYRTGGFDRLLAGAPGCPTSVHELTEVRPGAALDYLAAVRAERVPLMAQYGHRLVGLWEVMMTDIEVCTVWATEPADHARLGKARDVARGLLAADAAGIEGDPRIDGWHVRAREFTTRWREELMTPAPGTLLAPEDIPVDDSVA
jgi:hypothetical protein